MDLISDLQTTWEEGKQAGGSQDSEAHGSQVTPVAQIPKEPSASSPPLPWGQKRSDRRSSCRNGLGPVKEGEAQYAVVHCTGYIKAWPPAGK